MGGVVDDMELVCFPAYLGASNNLVFDISITGVVLLIAGILSVAMDENKH